MGDLGDLLARAAAYVAEYRDQVDGRPVFPSDADLGAMAR